MAQRLGYFMKRRFRLLYVFHIADGHESIVCQRLQRRCSKVGLLQWVSLRSTHPTGLTLLVGKVGLETGTKGFSLIHPQRTAAESRQAVQGIVTPSGQINGSAEPYYIIYSQVPFFSRCSAPSLRSRSFSIYDCLTKNLYLPKVTIRNPVSGMQTVAPIIAFLSLKPLRIRAPG